MNFEHEVIECRKLSILLIKVFNNSIIYVRENLRILSLEKHYRELPLNIHYFLATSLLTPHFFFFFNSSKLYALIQNLSLNEGEIMNLWNLKPE